MRASQAGHLVVELEAFGAPLLGERLQHAEHGAVLVQARRGHRQAERVDGGSRLRASGCASGVARRGGGLRYRALRRLLLRGRRPLGWLGGRRGGRRRLLAAARLWVGCRRRRFRHRLRRLGRLTAAAGGSGLRRVTLARLRLGLARALLALALALRLAAAVAIRGRGGQRIGGARRRRTRGALGWRRPGGRRSAVGGDVGVRLALGRRARAGVVCRGGRGLLLRGRPLAGGRGSRGLGRRLGSHRHGSGGLSGRALGELGAARALAGGRLIELVRELVLLLACALRAALVALLGGGREKVGQVWPLISRPRTRLAGRERAHDLSRGRVALGERAGRGRGRAGLPIAFAARGCRARLLLCLLLLLLI